MSIHPTAIIDPSAQIGKDVTVGPYCIVGPSTVLGDRCKIISHAVIEYTELGSDCVVFPQASLGLAPQHMGYKDEPTKLIVGNGCTFREGVTAHRGSTFDKSVTRIGNNGFFMALSHVAHDCTLGDNVVMANGSVLAGHVEVGDRVFISGVVAIHQRVRIGQQALVSGGAMVVLDVPPFTIVQGDRAVLKGLNVVGMRRNGMNRESVKRVKDAYRATFLSQLSLVDALNHPALNVDSAEVRIFKEFLSTPKRGFVRPASVRSETEEEALA